jgi:SAM-dependent methyltransferase
LAADAYRVQREWARYEGTAQRDLFLGLRERFLARHPAPLGWVADLGCGPGRFERALGAAGARVVGIDLSGEMLRFHAPLPAVAARPDRVRGDAARPPLRPASCSGVAVLGNLVGFSEERSTDVFRAAASLVSPGGSLLVEVAPGTGERSRYLGRLPAGSVARLLRAPPRAVLPRIRREGFVPERPRKSEEGPFARVSVPEAIAILEECGLRPEEVLAVAPALGADAERVERVRADPKAWEHLLQIEEELGHDAGRWPGAAAVVIAARRERTIRESM